MTKTLLELAREAVRLRTVMDDCLAVEYRDASYKFHEAYRQFEMEATPPRIIQLCEALEELLADIADYERINNLAPTPGKKDCWQSVTRARRALNGE